MSRKKKKWISSSPPSLQGQMDIEEKFPNFCALTPEEKAVFFETLIVARANLEKQGKLKCDRFGTIHDEYLKYFNNEVTSPTSTEDQPVSENTKKKVKKHECLRGRTNIPGNNSRKKADDLPRISKDRINISKENNEPKKRSGLKDQKSVSRSNKPTAIEQKNSGGVFNEFKSSCATIVEEETCKSENPMEGVNREPIVNVLFGRADGKAEARGECRAGKYRLGVTIRSPSRKNLSKSESEAVTEEKEIETGETKEPEIISEPKLEKEKRELDELLKEQLEDAEDELVIDLFTDREGRESFENVDLSKTSVRTADELRMSVESIKQIEEETEKPEEQRGKETVNKESDTVTDSIKKAAVDIIRKWLKFAKGTENPVVPPQIKQLCRDLDLRGEGLVLISQMKELVEQMPVEGDGRGFLNEININENFRDSVKQVIDDLLDSALSSENRGAQEKQQVQQEPSEEKDDRERSTSSPGESLVVNVTDKSEANEKIGKKRERQERKEDQAKDESGEEKLDSKKEELRTEQGEAEKRRRESLGDSSYSGSSRETLGSRDECVALTDKLQRPPVTKVRTLQDLLKDRAVFVVDSADSFVINFLPQEEFVKPERKGKTVIADSDEELNEEQRKKGFVAFLQRIFKRNRRDTDRGEVIAENLQGETVNVEVGKRSKDAASATLDDSTIEVLEAAKRKRLISQYLKASTSQQ